MKSVISMLITLAALSIGQSQAMPITNLLALGDSLSDSGNLFAASGQPPSPYFEGRFTNGPTFVEYLNSDLHLGELKPSLLGGQNYAWGGARAGQDIPFNGSAIPGLATQTNLLLTDLGTNTIDPETLILMYIGNNDVADVIQAQLDNNQAMFQFNQAVDEILLSIGMLSDAGASQFMIPLVPDWSLAPRFLNDPRASELTSMYNSLLTTSLDNLSQLDIATFDTTAFFIENQSHFAVIDSPCLALGCPSVEDYLFFDDIHPTTLAHEMLAKGIEQQLGITVPVPSTLWLAVLGFLVMARRRRDPKKRLPVSLGASHSAK